MNGRVAGRRLVSLWRLEPGDSIAELLEGWSQSGEGKQGGADCGSHDDLGKK
jgi:hypothetical protein